MGRTGRRRLRREGRKSSERERERGPVERPWEWRKTRSVHVQCINMLSYSDSLNSAGTDMDSLLERCGTQVRERERERERERASLVLRRSGQVLSPSDSRESAVAMAAISASVSTRSEACDM